MPELSSVHIQLPESLSNKIINWCDTNISEDNIFVDAGNHFYGREGDPHITLLYGLHATSSKDCIQLFKNKQKFEVTLKEMFVFRKQHFCVLAIRVESEMLYELNSLLKKIPHTNKNVYVPHITVAYLYNPVFGNFEDTKFTADNYVFSYKGIKEKFYFI